MAFYIALGVFAIVGIYIFISTKRRPVGTFPKEWQSLLTKNVAYYRNLAPGRQAAFRKRMMQFLSEVYIDGVGTTVTDLDRILIAASAVIPVFGFKEWHYYNLSGVLLYPDHFNEELEFADNLNDRNIGGLIGTGRFEKQMVLSRKALYYGFKNKTDKSNTGIHEFVHLIDKMDDITDGIPEHIMQQEYVVPWLDLIHREMEAINEDESDIRKYGATNRAEFFAVASEYFFERPALLKRKHPELYAMLTTFFKQKPKAVK